MSEKEDLETTGRVTRAATRRFSTDVANSQESLSRTPQKASRSRLKSITEKAKKNEVDDDASSVSTVSSTSSLKRVAIILNRIDESKYLPSVVKTRSRSKSKLTEENLANYSPARRTLRSTSSDDVFGSASSQPTLRTTRRNTTPSKEIGTVQTPTRKAKARVAKRLNKSQLDDEPRTDDGSEDGSDVIIVNDVLDTIPEQNMEEEKGSSSKGKDASLAEIKPKRGRKTSKADKNMVENGSHEDEGDVAKLNTGTFMDESDGHELDTNPEQNIENEEQNDKISEVKPKREKKTSKTGKSMAENIGKSPKVVDRTVSDLNATAMSLDKTSGDAENLSKTADTPKKTSENLNNAAEKLDETAANLEKTAENLEKSTKDLDETTANLDVTSMSPEKSVEILDKTAANLEKTAESSKKTPHTFDRNLDSFMEKSYRAIDVSAVLEKTTTEERMTNQNESGFSSQPDHVTESDHENQEVQTAIANVSLHIKEDNDHVGLPDQMNESAMDIDESSTLPVLNASNHNVEEMETSLVDNMNTGEILNNAEITNNVESVMETSVFTKDSNTIEATVETPAKNDDKVANDTNLSVVKIKDEPEDYTDESSVIDDSQLGNEQQSVSAFLKGLNCSSVLETPPTSMDTTGHSEDDDSSAIVPKSHLNVHEVTSRAQEKAATPQKKKLAVSKPNTPSSESIKNKKDNSLNDRMVSNAVLESSTTPRTGQIGISSGNSPRTPAAVTLGTEKPSTPVQMNNNSMVSPNSIVFDRLKAPNSKSPAVQSSTTPRTGQIGISSGNMSNSPKTPSVVTLGTEKPSTPLQMNKSLLVSPNSIVFDAPNSKSPADQLNIPEEEVNTSITPEKDSSDAVPSKKTSRKSVTITATPKDSTDNNSSKRIDTPYPDYKVLSFSGELAAGLSSSNSFGNQSVTEDPEKKEKLRKLSASWSQSIKRNIKEAPFIDGLGIAKKNLDSIESPKPLVIAPPNRLERGYDTSSSDVDIEGNGQEEEEEEEGEKEKCEFIDDEAEEVDEYEDSMDEEERREMEENEIIEYGESLGSEDTEEVSDEYEEDASFIVTDDEIHDAEHSDEFDSENDEDFEPEQKTKLKADKKGRFSRIIRDETESDEEENMEASASNEPLETEKITEANVEAPKVDVNEENVSKKSTSSLNKSNTKLNQTVNTSIRSNSGAFIEEEITNEDGVETGQLNQHDVSLSVNELNTSIMNKSKSSKKSKTPRNSILNKSVNNLMLNDSTSSVFTKKEVLLQPEVSEAINNNNDWEEMEVDEDETDGEAEVNKEDNQDQSNEEITENQSNDEKLQNKSNEEEGEVGAEIEESSSSDEDNGVLYSLSKSYAQEVSLRLSNSNVSVKETSSAKINVSKAVEDKENIDQNGLAVPSFSAKIDKLSKSLGLSNVFALTPNPADAKSLHIATPNNSIHVFPLSLQMNNLKQDSSTPKATGQKNQFAADESKINDHDESKTSTEPNSSIGKRRRSKSLTTIEPVEQQEKEEKLNKSLIVAGTSKQSIDYESIMSRCTSEIATSHAKKQDLKAAAKAADPDYSQEKLEGKLLKKEKKLKLEQAKISKNKIPKQKFEEINQPLVDERPSDAQVITLKRKRTHNSSDEMSTGAQTSSKKVNTKKYFNILTSNGFFTEEPITPPSPKLQNGFRVSPLTPQTGFKVKSLISKPNLMFAKYKKRKVTEIAEPVTFLPKPKWMNNDEEETQQSKRKKPSDELEIYGENCSTRFIVKPIEKRKKQRAEFLIPQELLEYRKQNLYRKGIPRQNSRNLLRQLEKRNANSKI